MIFRRASANTDVRFSSKASGVGGGGAEIFCKLLNNRATAHPGTAVRLACLSAGLLAGSRYTSGRSCYRPTGSRLSVLFLSLRANVGLVPSFRVALNAFHVALSMLTSNFSLFRSHKTNKKFEIVYEDPARLLFLFHFSSHLIHFRTPYPRLTYFYQKDEWALLGDLRGRKF
jgi:hypothetical protein